MAEGRGVEPKRLNFIYRWVLKGRMDCYANILEPREKSYLIRFFFKRFGLGKISDQSKNRILELVRQGRVVFALKDRSRLDFIFIHHLFSENDLPAPLISADLPIWSFFRVDKLFRCFCTWLVAKFNFWSEFRAGYWQEVKRQVDSGKGMLTYLINPPMLTKRYLHPEEDSFYNLLLWQSESEQDYLIVPLVVMWRREPEHEERGLVDILFGTVDQPGHLRRFYNYAYLILMEEAIIEAADPVNLRQFMDRTENHGLSPALLAHRLREHLIGHMEREKKVIVGPRLKSRSRLMEEVLQDQLFGRRLEEIAEDQDRKLIDVKREAALYLKEMAANYNQRMISFLDLVLTRVFHNLFSGIEVDEAGLEKIRAIAKRYPIIYVPSHKSHIDYLVLSYVLYHKNFVPPHIVAGINLSFFPLGTIFRGAGAFFMRRKFKGNKVYSLVFPSYLKTLVKEDYPIEVFIEGGRSRTGRLLQPKMGVVKYVVRAYRELGLKDIQFVPIYIGYDQVMEQAGYLREIKGEEKGSALGSIPRSQRLIRDKYGKIYLSFGEPISLKEYLEKSGEQVDAGHEEAGDATDEGLDFGFETLGNGLVKEINRLTMVTPGSLVACTLLSSSKPARKETELKYAWNWLYQYLLERKVRMSKTFENNRYWYEEALEFYKSKKMVNFLPDQESSRQIISIPDNSRLNLEFYKNNIIHFFLPASFTALLKLQGKSQEQMLKDYRRLKRMFRFDFVWPESASEDDDFKAALAYFEDQADAEELKNFAGLVANFLESYSIALKTLLSLGAGETTEQEFLSRAQKIGNQDYTLRNIGRKESISKLNFQSAFTWMKAERWLVPENSGLKLAPDATRTAQQEMAWLNSLLSTIQNF